MGFKQFVSGREVPQGTAIVIGKRVVMGRMFPQIREHGWKDQGTSGGQPFTFEDNPDMLVCYDRRTGRFARGTWNCLLCVHRKSRQGAQDLCDEMGQDLTQRDLFRYDMGGCVFVNCFELLGHTQPANASDTSPLYYRIHEEADKGAVFELTPAGFKRLVAPDFDRPPD